MRAGGLIWAYERLGRRYMGIVAVGLPLYGLNPS